MGREQQAAPALVIRHMPAGRRRRIAHGRFVALAVIVAVAASGALLQELQMRASMAERGIDFAAAPTPPGPFDYFPS